MTKKYPKNIPLAVTEDMYVSLSKVSDAIPRMTKQALLRTIADEYMRGLLVPGAGSTLPNITPEGPKELPRMVLDLNTGQMTRGQVKTDTEVSERPWAAAPNPNNVRTVVAEPEPEIEPHGAVEKVDYRGVQCPECLEVWHPDGSSVLQDVGGRVYCHSCKGYKNKNDIKR